MSEQEGTPIVAAEPDATEAPAPNPDAGSTVETLPTASEEGDSNVGETAPVEPQPELTGPQGSPLPEPAPEPAAAPVEDWYYCLNEQHPGAPNFASEPVNVSRIFSFKGDGVPVCPACGTEGNAIPCEGPDIPPQFVLELAERLGR